MSRSNRVQRLLRPAKAGLAMTLFFIFHPASFPLFAEEPPPYDYLIQNALIYDGVSFEGFQGDIAINRNEIVAIGDLSGKEAFQIVDAKGLIAAPGFIDVHTHSDLNPFVYAIHSNKILQGVTTEVTGNCGFSAAPVVGLHEKHVRSVWAREGVFLRENVPWKTFQDYRDALQNKKLITNHVPLIGHGNLRSAVMGMSPRPATKSEILEMKEFLAIAMQDGAWGISFGLGYLPGMFAQEEELVELCGQAARHAGICTFHIRNEGSQLIESLEEAIRVGKKAQARIEISHLKAGGGRRNRGKIEAAFQLIERARLDGLLIAADAYPYAAGFAELGVVLPDSIYGRKDRVEYFKSLTHRQELLEELRNHYERNQMTWDWVMVASTPHKKYWDDEGKMIKEIARQKDIEPEQFLIEILADTSFEVSAFYFSQDQRVVDRVIQKSYVMIGSDSIADEIRKPHPRAYGTFPKIFREYVQKKKILGMGDAIRKMTSLPAEHFGIENRGRLEPGYYADLVLFDPQLVMDKATFEFPKNLPLGVYWVFVDGKPVVERGKFTGLKQGQVLRH